MQHFQVLFVVHNGVCGKNCWPDAGYNFFLECQYIIYQLVQNIITGDMNL